MARRFETGVDLRNQRAINIASGTQPTDAVNLQQLQNAINGLSWHGAVIAASTANITLSGPGTTIDGVAMAAGQRFLAKNQTDATTNGVYIWNGAAAAATRAADGVQGNLNGGAAFYVEAGTVNGDAAFTLTTDDPITVGTTALAFAKFSGGGTAYTAGAGLTLSGTTFAVDTTVVARKYAANVGDGASTSITLTHSLATLDVVVQLYLIATGETIEADVVRATTNTVTLGFASAPASGSMRAVVMG